ncbi:Mth938-like domain-containing protein [Roseinatronobacter alkalisoli]|uniref:Mth938-like domain-containing protein n=1 Tax=Roseinatronobacter alkalisoli TaxID=3028235 RepID=A0ABT5T823_9RHOB|nr:Mth938-like domain-containing protein [Roseinatronobacter sp. HJB301]MDD7971277.1 Mth938-like domain-containing protein [Roseinatronobacter sp. HJB301]
MHLSEVDFGAARPVDGYGKDFFRIGGNVHPAPLLLVAGEVLPWGGYDDDAALLELAGHVDVLFIGTGGAIAHIPPALRDKLEAAGLGVEIMDSPAACRTYNVVLSEQRRVAVALLPVG